MFLKGLKHKFSSARIINSKLDVHKIADSYQKKGFIRIENLWDPVFWNNLSRETFSVIEKKKKMMKMELSNTTRNLYVVGGTDIDELHYPSIHKIARSEEVLQTIKQITGNKNLRHGRHPPLFPAHINLENRIGHHHGWHLDDAGFKLVIYIKWRKHPQETGGRVGFVKNWVPDGLIRNKLMERLYNSKKFALSEEDEDKGNYLELFNKKIPHKNIGYIDLTETESYFMEGRKTLHCVEALSCDSERISLCYSFDDIHDESNYEHSATSLYSK